MGLNWCANNPPFFNLVGSRGRKKQIHILSKPGFTGLLWFYYVGRLWFYWIEVVSLDWIDMIYWFGQVWFTEGLAEPPTTSWFIPTLTDSSFIQHWPFSPIWQNGSLLTSGLFMVLDYMFPSKFHFPLLTLWEHVFPAHVSLRMSAFSRAWDVKLHNQADKWKRNTSIKVVL